MSGNCREEVIKALQVLKWKVNNKKQEKLAPNECYVTVKRVSPELDTTETYILWTHCAIVWNEDDPRRLTERISNILSHVEKSVVDSGCENCTTFKFGDANIDDLGLTMHVELEFNYRDVIYHG